MPGRAPLAPTMPGAHNFKSRGGSRTALNGKGIFRLFTKPSILDNRIAAGGEGSRTVKSGQGIDSAGILEISLDYSVSVVFRTHRK